MKVLCLVALTALFALLFAGDESNNPRHPNYRPKELVLFNGKVFTSDEDNLWVEALLIRGSRIAAVGDNDHVQAQASAHAESIDLDGRTVVPGFNDAHTHMMWHPNYYHEIDTGNFVPGPGPGSAEVFDLLREAAAALPPGTWIHGTVGAAFLDDTSVDRFALDEVVPSHPVKLSSWGGHGTVINTIAMQTAGISEEEPDPPGGFYGRVGDTDVLNGRVHEYAEWRLKGFLKNQVPTASAVQQIEEYTNAVLQFGTTSIQDMPVGFSKAQAERVLARVDLPIRVRTICFPLTPDEDCKSTLNSFKFKNRARPGVSTRLTSSGLKYISDGSPIERFARMRQEYSDLPGWLGFYTFDSVIGEIVTRSKNGNFRDQLIMHAVGNSAIDEVLFEMETQDEGGTWTDRRTRIEHGDTLMQDQFDLMRRHDVILVQNPLHFALPETLLARYGEERFAVMQPLRSVIEAGIVVALASDFTAGPANPFLDLMFAVLHPTNPEEAITMEQAVIAYTWGSAYAEHQDHRKGTLEPGMWADLAVLSQDIFTIDPFDVPGTVSLMTFVGGEIEYDAGVFTIQK
ncbi:MAG: amidohydrolase family protein [Acidobacteriota bacterium]|nr:amidohydrolase family protein [Acidobacteriota bacterium]